MSQIFVVFRTEDREDTMIKAFMDEESAKLAKDLSDGKYTEEEIKEFEAFDNGQWWYDGVDIET